MARGQSRRELLSRGKSLRQVLKAQAEEAPFSHDDKQKSENSPQSLLGTPDYLAPELLLGLEHGQEVDWWAFGLCLFEFLAGYPPFADETPELIFRNILNHDIEWPLEGISPEARDLIVKLLNPNPKERLGASGVKAHPFFKSIDWATIHEQKMPFVPRPDDITDTSYFDSK